MPCDSSKPPSPNRWQCAPELLASAAGQSLAAALATLAERAPNFLDIDANAAAPILPQAWDAYLAAEAQPPADADLRIQAAQLLATTPENIVWTAGGTEADVLALVGTLAPGERVATSPIEHAAVAQLLEHLARTHDIDVAALKLAEGGIVDVARLTESITPGTKLVTCMAANNETGVIQPLAQIAQRCAEVGAILHIDAVQAVGRTPHALFLNLPGKTLVGLAGHKIGATGHTGLLRLQNVELQDALGLRQLAPLADRAHIAGCASLVAALRFASDGASDSSLTALRDLAEQRILALGYGAQVVGAQHARLGNTSCIHWPNIESEAVLMALDSRNITIGAGAACSSGSTEPSPTLLAMGMTPAQARCCIRLSWQRGAKEGDVLHLIVNLRDILALLSSELPQ